ncbi:MAG: hypothetical protein NZ990_04260, partial [Myxococcota bacterium]|nr:hypothetical protein [Myxococcota bacterium]
MDVEHPQPTLFALVQPGFVRYRFPRLSAVTEAMNILGRHIDAGASIVVDGDRVEGEVRCTHSGELPNCNVRQVTIQLSQLPAG